MQSFLQKDALEQLGIYHFDSWAANFGEVTTFLELSVEGNGSRFRNRFNKFVNLPELMNLFKEVADIRTRDTLDLKVPELRDGNYKIISSEPDWYTKQVMEEFVERAERIHSGGVDPSEDNFLKITNDARLLGTDARLLYPEAPENPGGKLNLVVDNVYEEYKRAENLGIIGTQLVFSDIGTPKSNWKEEMKDVLKEQLAKAETKVQELHERLVSVKDSIKQMAKDTVGKMKQLGDKALFTVVELTHFGKLLDGIRKKAEKTLLGIGDLSDRIREYKKTDEIKKQNFFQSEAEKTWNLMDLYMQLQRNRYIIRQS